MRPSGGHTPPRKPPWSFDRVAQGSAAECSDGRDLTRLRAEPGRNVAAEDRHNGNQRDGHEGYEETVFGHRNTILGAEKLLHTWSLHRGKGPALRAEIVRAHNR